MKTLIIFTLLALLLSPIAIAHDGAHDEGEEHASYYRSFSAALPFVYFAEGNYFTGVLVIVLWAAIIYGVYNLAMMSLARLAVEEKPKRK